MGQEQSGTHNAEKNTLNVSVVFFRKYFPPLLAHQSKIVKNNGGYRINKNYDV